MNEEINKNLSKVKETIKKNFPKKKGWTFLITLWEDNDYSIEGTHSDKLNIILKVYYQKSTDKLIISENEDRTTLNFDYHNWKNCLKNIKEIIRDKGTTPNSSLSKTKLVKMEKLLKNREKFVEKYRTFSGLYLDRNLIKSVELDYKNKRKIINNNPSLDRKRKKELINKTNELEQKKIKEIKELIEWSKK